MREKKRHKNEEPELQLKCEFSLQLDVDDSEMVKTRGDGRRRIVTTSPLYFGGVPPGYAIVSQNVGTETRFIGCIGDVTVNGG